MMFVIAVHGGNYRLRAFHDNVLFVIKVNMIMLGKKGFPIKTFDLILLVSGDLALFAT